MIDWKELKYDMQKKWRDIKRPFTSTFEWVIKSVQYSWQIRPGQDYDWDYSFAMKLFKYKLERTRKRIKKNNIIAGVDRVCKQIRVAEILIERILDDNYAEDQYDELEKKWGPIDFEKSDQPGFSCLKRMFVITDKDRAEEQADVMRAGHHAMYMREQDLDYLFKHLRKYITHWWD